MLFSRRTEIEVVERLRYETAVICRYLSHTHLVDEFGHASTRTPDGQKIIVCPSGVPMERVKPQDMVVVDVAGNILSGANPPGELQIHLAIYDRRPDVHAIIHAHPHYITTLTIAGKRLIPVAQSGCIIRHDYRTADSVAPVLTRQDADQLATMLDNDLFIIMRAHGIVAVGQTSQEALAVCSLIENNARLQFDALSINCELRSLSGKEIIACNENLWLSGLGAKRIWRYAQVQSGLKE